MTKLSPEIKAKLDKFLEETYFNVAGTGGSGALSEEYIIKLVTRFIVSCSSAWFAIVEILEYVRKRKLLSEKLINDGTLS